MDSSVYTAGMDTNAYPGMDTYTYPGLVKKLSDSAALGIISMMSAVQP